MDKNFEPIEQLYLSQAFDTNVDEDCCTMQERIRQPLVKLI